MPDQFSWHSKTIPETLIALRSREHGLTKEEAVKRLQEYGLNKFPEGKTDSLPVIFCVNSKVRLFIFCWHTL